MEQWNHETATVVHPKSCGSFLRFSPGTGSRSLVLVTGPVHRTMSELGMSLGVPVGRKGERRRLAAAAARRLAQRLAIGFNLSRSELRPLVSPREELNYVSYIYIIYIYILDISFFSYLK